jgi:O-acetyl-ADP-ribose deacetylase (regulator of RNase III)
MVYYEIHGDLFEVDSKYYLCHCISADFALGKGIAVEFNKRFNMRNKLHNQYLVNSDYPVCLMVDNVFNLVTKEKYWHKPTYNTLRRALVDMRNHIERYEIKYLAMPTIGSGLDRLDWIRVSEMIKEVFCNTDIEILVVKR